MRPTLPERRRHNGAHTARRLRWRGTRQRRRWEAPQGAQATRASSARETSTRDTPRAHKAIPRGPAAEPVSAHSAWPHATAAPGAISPLTALDPAAPIPSEPLTLTGAERGALSRRPRHLGPPARPGPQPRLAPPRRPDAPGGGVMRARRASSGLRLRSPLRGEGPWQAFLTRREGQPFARGARSGFSPSPRGARGSGGSP